MYCNDELFKEYQKTRDINIRNQITLNNKGLIYPIIKRFYNPKFNDFEEIEQEAIICLIKAVEDFKPELGYQFSTYASKCLMKITRRKLEYNQEKSLDEPIKDKDELERTTLIDTIKDESATINYENRFINERLKNILTDDEFFVMKYIYKYGYSIRDIGQIMDKSKSTVMNLKTRANKKIYNDPYFLSYKQILSLNYNVTYLNTSDYTKPRVQTSNISNPVWRAVLQKEYIDNQIIKSAFK